MHRIRMQKKAIYILWECGFLIKVESAPANSLQRSCVVSLIVVLKRNQVTVSHQPALLRPVAPSTCRRFFRQDYHLQDSLQHRTRLLVSSVDHAYVSGSRRSQHSPLHLQVQINHLLSSASLTRHLSSSFCCARLWF